MKVTKTADQIILNGSSEIYYTVLWLLGLLFFLSLGVSLAYIEGVGYVFIALLGVPAAWSLTRNRRQDAIIDVSTKTVTVHSHVFFGLLKKTAAEPFSNIRSLQVYYDAYASGAIGSLGFETPSCIRFEFMLKSGETHPFRTEPRLDFTTYRPQMIQTEPTPFWSWKLKNLRKQKYTEVEVIAPQVAEFVGVPLAADELSA